MAPAEVSDQHIIDLYKSNQHEEAFRLLIAKYQSRLYWHIRKLVISHDDADDLVQEVFVKIWQNLSKFRGDASLFTWVYRIATNETLTFLRKNNKRKTVSIDSDDLNWDNYLASDSYFNGSEIEKRLHASVQTLPEKQRLVFQMKYFEEMKYEEISEVLKVSVGSLKASFHHAVKKIETIFEKEL